MGRWHRPIAANLAVWWDFARLAFNSFANRRTYDMAASHLSYLLGQKFVATDKIPRAMKNVRAHEYLKLRGPLTGAEMIASGHWRIPYDIKYFAEKRFIRKA